MRTPTAAAARLAAVLTVAPLLGGCASQARFSGDFYYEGLISDNAAAEIRSVVFDELVAGAGAAGLELVSRGERRVVFRTQAPNWIGRDGDGAPVERADTRRITVEVEMGGVHGVNTYRYRATMAGPEPGRFGAEARARLGAALVALRRIFEAPLTTDFFPATMGSEPPTP